MIKFFLHEKKIKLRRTRQLLFLAKIHFLKTETLLKVSREPGVNLIEGERDNKVYGAIDNRTNSVLLKVAAIVNRTVTVQNHSIALRILML